MCAETDQVLLGEGGGEGGGGGEGEGERGGGGGGGEGEGGREGVGEEGLVHCKLPEVGPLLSSSLVTVL